MRRVKGLGAAAATALLLSACTGTGPPAGHRQATPHAADDGASVPKEACLNAVTLGEDRVLDLSDASEFQAWGLVDTPDASTPFRVGSQVGIRWRVTGTGAFDTWLRDPQGNRIEVPNERDTSPGGGPDKPGEGWGAVYEFDEPGCWSLMLQRVMSDHTVAISIDLLVERLSSFGSVDEAYAAVAEILDCDPDTAAEPVTVQVDGYLPEYRMCTDAVEIVRYENEDVRIKASELIDGAENGRPSFVEGSNWHVLVLPGREGETPGPDELSALAKALGGRYVSTQG